MPDIPRHILLSSLCKCLDVRRRFILAVSQAPYCIIISHNIIVRVVGSSGVPRRIMTQHPQIDDDSWSNHCNTQRTYKSDRSVSTSQVRGVSGFTKWYGRCDLKHASKYRVCNGGFGVASRWLFSVFGVCRGTCCNGRYLTSKLVAFVNHYKVFVNQMALGQSQDYKHTYTYAARVLGAVGCVTLISKTRFVAAGPLRGQRDSRRKSGEIVYWHVTQREKGVEEFDN